MNRYLIWVFLIIVAIGVSLSTLFSIETTLESPNTPPPAQAAAAEAQDTAEAPRQPYTRARSLSGSYLAARFAQRHYDWKLANNFIGQLLAHEKDNPALLKRTMVLAMGAGEPEQAVALAERIEALDEKDDESPGALSELFLAVGKLKQKQYKAAHDHIEAMPEGGLSDFIMPMLRGWAKAGIGMNETDDLITNSVHLYHAIMIDDFLGDQDKVEDMLNQALNAPALGPADLERIGDLFAHIDKKETAKDLYKNALLLEPDNAALALKLEMFEDGQSETLFTHIETAEQGFAEALFDMATILAQDYSDESARVFVQMAIYLNPALTKGKLLLAALAARNERYDEAIAAFMSISAEDEAYVEARRSAAELMNEHGQKDQALVLLESLATEKNDVEALIQIGDIHRMDEEPAQAIAAYNRAVEALGGEIPSDYWHLAYVRGMSYEQNKEWDKAEKDLQLALSYQPSHPYILNYIGYAWADQGKNLDEALSMIEKAVTLEPDDGYIMDSMGWVLFQMRDFKNAVPFLEQAVELMPYDAIINDHLGDAYWRVGRRMEARFQWERAKNHAEDESVISEIEDKIINGMSAITPQDGPKKSLAQDEAKKKKQSAL